MTIRSLRVMVSPSDLSPNDLLEVTISVTTNRAFEVTDRKIVGRDDFKSLFRTYLDMAAAEIEGYFREDEDDEARPARPEPPATPSV